MAPTKVDPWIRLFDVGEPSLHKKGYTIYKVTSTVFPRNCPEAATQLIAWRRFSDFKKLYKGLHNLHASLHLKGNFPRFPKDKVFGRFEPDVIEERRQSALQLLEFVAKFPPLFTSQLFVKFFEGCKRSLLADEHVNEVKDRPVLQPVIVYELPSNDQTCEQAYSNSGDSASQLGGVWQYCRATDDVSLGSTDDSDETLSNHDSNAAADDASVQSPISAEDIAFFDPLKSPSSSVIGQDDAGSTTFDNSWLLSALAHCQSPSALVTPVLDEGGDGGIDRSLPVSATFEFPRAFAEFDDDDANGGNRDVGQEQENSGARGPSAIFDLLGAGGDPWATPEDKPVRTLAPIRFEETWTMASESGRDQPGDYLVTTAQLLTDAQECEANGDYERAFGLYKTVVGMLLSGVQEDLDPIRRDAVRRKTAHYLQRAEEIYQNHLAKKESNEVRWAVTQQQKSQLESESQIKLLKSPPSELGRYKVLGVIGKVMLALDSFTNTPLAIKVLAKSAKTDIFMSPWVVPSNVPYMVQLLRFHETEESIFLVLQNAVGGKLWHYISSYLQGCGVAGANFLMGDQVFDPDGWSSSPANITNVYTGRKFLDNAAFGGKVSFDSRDFVGSVTEPDTRHAEEEDCSSSYVQLFTNSATSLRSRDQTSLAECRFVSARFQKPSRQTNPALVKLAADDMLTSENMDVSSYREFEDGDGNKSWTNLLENVDPNELISNAQKLMDHVDETIRETNRAPDMSDLPLRGILGESPTLAPALSDANISRALDSPKPMQPRKYSDLSRKRVRRQTSDDAFHGPNVECQGPTRRSSAGSLELKTSRVRHLSSVFRQLDEKRNSATSVGIPESCIRVWAAEIVIAISSLHDKGIICRDLKPDNVLLGERGHIMLSYFSQWPSVERNIDSAAKECLYAAPEIGGIFPVTPACDWWSLGALMFELLTGKTLVSCHPGGFTSHTQLNIPCPISVEADDLLRKVLCFNSSERLEVESVKAHSFFMGIDWKDFT